MCPQCCFSIFSSTQILQFAQKKQYSKWVAIFSETISVYYTNQLFEMKRWNLYNLIVSKLKIFIYKYNKVDNFTKKPFPLLNPVHSPTDIVLSHTTFVFHLVLLTKRSSYPFPLSAFYNIYNIRKMSDRRSKINQEDNNH